MFVVGAVAFVMVGGLAAGLRAAGAVLRAPDADTESTPTIAMRLVMFQATRDGDGWRIDNRTDGAGGAVWR